MFCPNCGTQVADQTRFCGSCGTALSGGAGPAGGPLPAPYTQPMAGQPQPAPQRKRGMPGWAIALIVVAVIVVAVPVALLAIAIPAYQNYLVRTQVTEGMTLAQGAKVAVFEYYSNNDRWPSNNADAGLAAASSITGAYVSSVQIEPGTGVVVVTYSSNPPFSADSSLDGKQFVLVPQVQHGTVTWSCGGSQTTVPEKDLPSACRVGE